MGENEKVRRGLNRHQAVELAMEEFGTPIKRLLFSYVKDWGIASDLSQDVFVAIYEKWDSFQGRSSFKTWVFSIAINKAKDYLKSWHYRTMRVVEPFSFLHKSSEETPENHLMRIAEHEDVTAAVFSLPLKYREVLLLHFYQDLNFNEISTVIDVPVATVKTRLHRAKGKMKGMDLFNERRGQHGGF